METIGSKRSYALTWCMLDNDDDDDDIAGIYCQMSKTFIGGAIC